MLMAHKIKTNVDADSLPVKQRRRPVGKTNCPSGKSGCPLFPARVGLVIPCESTMGSCRWMVALHLGSSPR